MSVKKLFIPVLFLFLQLLHIPAFALEPDKVSHFTGAALLGIALDTAMYHYGSDMGPGLRMASSAGLATFPGLCIEIADGLTPHGKFSGFDLLADGLGGVFGAVTAELVNGQFWISASGRQIRLIGRW